MVMGATIVLVFVTGYAVVECQFRGESAFGKKFESAIDRGETDLWILLLDEAVEFVSRKMVANFEERLEDGVALLGVLESDSFEVSMEDTLGFEEHFPRNAGLIVNPLGWR